MKRHVYLFLFLLFIGNIKMELGRVIIESEPIGAKVYLNEVYYGLTPLDLRLPVGEYTSKLEKEGYKTRTLSIRAGTDFPPPEYWEILEK